MTTTTTITERQARLRDICENPREDLPRLAFADWIESRGEEQYAEFIRVQCELPELEQQAEHEIHNTGMRSPYCTLCPAIGHRHSIERKWIETNRKRLRKELGCDVGLTRQGFINDGFSECTFSRGLVSHVCCTFDQWRGGVCGCDNGSIDTGGTTPWGEPISDKCPHCNGTGRTNSIGAKLIGEELQPVVILEITDLDESIHRSGGNDTLYVGGLDRFPREYWSQLELFRNRLQAHLFVSRMLINIERRKVGLRDLTPEDCK